MLPSGDMVIPIIPFKLELRPMPPTEPAVPDPATATPAVELVAALAVRSTRKICCAVPLP